MPFFRRPSDLRDLICRPFTAADWPIVQDLAARSEWVALSVGLDELELVCDVPLSLVLEQRGRVVGAALAGWSAAPIAWLRAVVIAAELAPAAALPALLSALLAHLGACGVHELFFMSDAGDASWLRPRLLGHGFAARLDVIGYEKRALNVPDWGNRAAAIRPATPADVAEMARVDAGAFAPEWVKGPAILDTVFQVAPCYLVAELGGLVVGYAFATTHHGGLAAHLVRIAVQPDLQHQAIGVRLLAEVVEWCRLHGVQVLSLNTQATNSRAQQLYTWFGWTRTGERQTVLARIIDTAPSARRMA